MSALSAVVCFPAQHSSSLTFSLLLTASLSQPDYPPRTRPRRSRRRYPPQATRHRRWQRRLPRPPPRKGRRARRPHPFWCRHPARRRRGTFPGLARRIQRCALRWRHARGRRPHALLDVQIRRPLASTAADAQPRQLHCQSERFHQMAG